MKRFMLLGVAAIIFLGCTITFDTGDNNTSKNPALVVTIVTPTNNTVFLTNGFAISGTVTGGEVKIASVYVKIGGGSYTAVAGTSNLTAATAQAWIYNASGVATGWIYIYAKAVDMEGNTSTEISRAVYIADGGTLAPTLSITSPANYTYYEISDNPTISLIGTVQDDGALDYVYARWGALSAGPYTGVSGTHLISPVTPTAWTNSFPSTSGGAKMMWAYAKDLSGMYSSTNGVMVYLLDENEPNNISNNANVVPDFDTYIYARTDVANDIDWYKFSVTSSGLYDIYTTNADMGTDLDTIITFMQSDGTILATDDESAAWGNHAYIVDQGLLSGNSFFIVVCGYDTNRIGDYVLVVHQQ